MITSYLSLIWQQRKVNVIAFFIGGFDLYISRREAFTTGRFFLWFFFILNFFALIFINRNRVKKI